MLRPLHAKNIDCPHGFFTRQGGVSEGLYYSLNIAYGSSDTTLAIEENRQRIASYFHQDATRLLTLSQVHSNKCVIVDDTYDFTTRPSADALVTNRPGIILGILTADCVPVLLHDPQGGVIGAAHAGWKGAYSGIIQQTVESMCALGAGTDTIHAAIGPAIGQISYEVDDTFYDTICSVQADAAAYFMPSHTRPESHFQFDLKAYVANKLERCGIQSVSVMPQDTYALQQEFFSYRRSCHVNEPDYGRQCSAIML